MYQLLSLWYAWLSRIAAGAAMSSTSSADSVNANAPRSYAVSTRYSNSNDIIISPQDFSSNKRLSTYQSE